MKLKKKPKIGRKKSSNFLHPSYLYITRTHNSSIIQLKDRAKINLSQSPKLRGDIEDVPGLEEEHEVFTNRRSEEEK
jgi:hypothetical protein